MSPPPLDDPFAADRLTAAAEFVPEWDVPSFGRDACDALDRELDAVRTELVPTGARKVHALLGPSGYGKTHLFGRLLHRHGERVHLAYVPMTSDPARVPPADHVRWCVVESLFQGPGGRSPVRAHLARLLAPSFAAYFDQAPDSLRARCLALVRRLESDPAAVLDVVGPVTDLAPYHHLADSVRRRWPGLSAGAVRALVLALSPAADDARAWLRGERDAVAEDRLRELRLADEPPDATAALQAAAALLQAAGTPLLVCLDQLEWLAQRDMGAFQALTTAVMGWLQQVPNTVFALGCLTDAWGEVLRRQAFQAFHQRARVWKLDQLTPDEAAELVARRTVAWAGRPAQAAAGWPFDLAALRAYAAKTPAGPRGLVQLCSAEFERWLAAGRPGPITLGGGAAADSPAEAFLREWSGRLEATRRGAKAPAHYQEAEVWDALRAALELARVGQYAPDGVRVEAVTDRALKASPSDDRPSANVNLVAGGERHAVVLAASKKDGGAAFAAWVGALGDALGGLVAGAVVVRPKAALSVGKTAKAFARHQEWAAAGTLRTFPLDENEDVFHQLLTLRELVTDAEGGNLTLGGRPVDAGRCRQLLVESGVLSKLKLFEILFCNWPKVEAARRAAKPAAPAPARLPAEAVGGPAPPGTAAAAPVPATVVVAAPAAEAGGPAWAAGMLDRVVQKLRGKGQSVRGDGYDLGPTFVRLKLVPRDDADFAKIKRQADNLKLHLGLAEKPLIGNQAGYVSVDVRRPDRQAVPLGPLLGRRPARLGGRPAFPVGVDVGGEAHWLDLSEPSSCHLLVAGTTGSGKSEFLKALLAGLAGQLGPDQVQFVLIDPKRVTFNLAGQSPYLAGPVVYDADGAVPAIDDCFREMERRYETLRALGKEHVGELTAADAVPRRVVVFDEFADLMADRAGKRELEAVLRRLGAKARAAGIHLVLGTQRPEASVVTPLLRSNLPGRVSLQVLSEKDSKLILDDPDAAHLLGRGDLLWRQGGGLLRLQSPFVAKPDLERALRLH